MPAPRPAPAAITGPDLQGARNLSAAAAAGGVQRIIYLGDCLRPQAEIAEVLQAGSVPATVLRAALILGSGSTSFEILRHLVERHPAMVVPRWIATPSYPIAIRNVLAYLIGCLEHEETAGETYDIGGPQALTYRELMEIYAQEAGLPRPHILTVPVAAVGMSVYWIHLVTPVPSALARPLVEGLCHSPVRPDERLRAIVPQELLTAREAIRLALERIRRFEVESHWSDATGVPPAEWTSPGDPAWAGATSLMDQPPHVVHERPAGAGGEAGGTADDTRSDRLRDAAQHSSEEQLVEREQRIPVQHPEPPSRVKGRRLHQFCAATPQRANLEFQPRPAGDSHLGDEDQLLWRAEVGNPPEVHGVPRRKGDRIAATPAQTDPAEKPVKRSAGSPQDIAVVPAGLTAEPAQ